MKNDNGNDRAKNFGPHMAKAEFMCSFLSTMITASLQLKDEEKAKYFATQLYCLRIQVHAAKKLCTFKKINNTAWIATLLSIGAIIGTAIMVAVGINPDANLNALTWACALLTAGAFATVLSLAGRQHMAARIKSQHAENADAQIGKIMKEHREQMEKSPGAQPAQHA